MAAASPEKTVAATPAAAKDDASKKKAEEEAKKAQETTGTSTLPSVPDMSLAQDLFLASLVATSAASTTAAAGAKDRLLKGIKEHSMVPFYEHVCQKLSMPRDEALVRELTAASEEKSKALAEKLKDAQENLGETEVADALHAQAAFLAGMGHKEKAIDAYLVAQEKTAALGGKIDVFFNITRIGFLYSDFALVDTYLEKAEALIAKGGDWDRRNRFKVYKGTSAMSKRDFTTAASLLLDALSTFTCTELMSYNTFVRYAVLSGALALERNDVKAKIIDAPEVLEVIHEMPYLESLIAALYNCQYGQLFSSLGDLETQLKHDRYTFPHYRFYVREMRIKAYAQLLESYRSVTLESMARAFGVTVDFIDADLSRFIASNRLHAVIDKVDGIVETNRPDAKNAQYQQVIKLGDVLISKIQKLSKVITI